MFLSRVVPPLLFSLCSFADAINENTRVLYLIHITNSSSTEGYQFERMQLETYSCSWTQHFEHGADLTNLANALQL